MTRSTLHAARGRRGMSFAGATPRAVALFLAAAGSGCGGASSGSDSGTGPIQRCDTCVGEDGGTPAPQATDGQTVAVLETLAGVSNEFVLRGTLPVPPGTYPRGDGLDPFVILDFDGTPVTTQTELVSRYADLLDGADVVEVLAKVHRYPAAAGGAPMRYDVVQMPHAAPAAAGSLDLDDLLATASVPASMQALLNDPTALEITTRDCFGNKYLCRPLDGSGDYRLIRHGPVTTELRIFQTMLPETFVIGPTGTLPHSFGVHVYISTLTGQEVLGLALRFSNGSSGRDTTTSFDDPLDKLYFDRIQVAVPANMAFMQDFDDPFLGSVASGTPTRWIWDLVEPVAGGKMHVIRWLGQFHRRLWIANGADVSVGRAYANGEGQGFCVRGTDSFSGQEYWSWWNKGTARYFPQRYQLPALDHIGLNSLRVQLANDLAHLTERLQNGTSDGNYPISSGVLGWGHPYGVSYGGMTSGNEIFCWDGVATAAAASYHGLQAFRALHRMQTDRQPNVLYDLDGQPSSVERWLRDNGANDYVPFSHYIVPLLGGSWPDPFGFASAPRFQIDHVAANGLKPPYEDGHLAFDPHDYQHFVRYTRSAKVLAWLGNDPIAKDDLREQAEMFHLSYHAYCNDVFGGAIGSGLRAVKNLVAANPGKGSPFGRGEAWGIDCALAAYSLGTPQFRAAKYPWFEDIAEVLLDMQGVCNGFLQAQVSSKAVGGKYRARQQIEQSITENMLQGLRESVFRGFDQAHADMVRDVLVESLYAFLGDMAWAPNLGPWRYTGVGPKDVTRPVWCSRSQMPGDAITPGDYETYQDWSSFAYGFEITGDPIFLARALVQLPGAIDLLTALRNEGPDNLENFSALLALMQHRNGQL